MKIVRAALIGIAPGVIGMTGFELFPALVDVLIATTTVLGIPCSFWGGFGIADQCTRSPGKNLAVGFSFTAFFIAINFGPLLAPASHRSKGYSDEQPAILEKDKSKDAEPSQQQ
jgi:hypothetical protein